MAAVGESEAHFHRRYGLGLAIGGVPEDSVGTVPLARNRPRSPIDVSFLNQRKGQIDRVNVSRLVRDLLRKVQASPGLRFGAGASPPGLLSRIARKVADQTSGCPDFHDAVDEKHLLVSEARFRGIGTEDRGRCPSSGHAHPVSLSLAPGFICGAGASPSDS